MALDWFEKYDRMRTRRLQEQRAREHRARRVILPAAVQQRIMQDALQGVATQALLVHGPTPTVTELVLAGYPTWHRALPIRSL